MNVVCTRGGPAPNRFCDEVLQMRVPVGLRRGRGQ